MSFVYPEGWADAVRAPIKLTMVLIGNAQGARTDNDPDILPPAANNAPMTFQVDFIVSKLL